MTASWLDFTVRYVPKHSNKMMLDMRQRNHQVSIENRVASLAMFVFRLFDHSHIPHLFITILDYDTVSLGRGIGFAAYQKSLAHIVLAGRKPRGVSKKEWLEHCLPSCFFHEFGHLRQDYENRFIDPETDEADAEKFASQVLDMWQQTNGIEGWLDAEIQSTVKEVSAWPPKLRKDFGISNNTVEKLQQPVEVASTGQKDSEQ